MNLRGKNVVLFGASSGLGKSLVKLLSVEEVNLILLSRGIGLTNFPDTVKIPCDIRKENEIVAAFKKIDSKFEKIDLLINCVGIGLVKDLRETGGSEIDNVINTNLKGAIIVAREAYKRMSQKSSGYIVIISSTSGRKVRAMETVYCATKWGLRGFTGSLQLAGEENGVKVTGVYPGGMKSKNFWSIVPGKDIKDYLEPAFVAEKIINLVKGRYKKELVIERASS
ncbi:SDR family oxidoreductase [Patescibacteria group bacterium]